MMEKVKLGYWIDKQGEFYQITNINASGCYAVKVKLNKSGHYKLTKEKVYFYKEELNRLLICPY